MTKLPLTASRASLVADDLGLSEEINSGIFQAFKEGWVTSASLLMNGLATAEAIRGLENVPGLEVGLHLGLVEGSALIKNTSLVGARDYFNSGGSLLENWQDFIPKFLARKIRLMEVRGELEAQIKEYLKYFKEIPFANSTQHLHLLPGISEVVVDLCVKYQIDYLRVPKVMPDLNRVSGMRRISGSVLQLLGKRTAKLLQGTSIKCADQFWGFPFSGRFTASELVKSLECVGPGFHEFMIHPGKDCPELRALLPRNYSDFFWEDELASCCSPAVKQVIAARGITVKTLSELL